MSARTNHLEAAHSSQIHVTNLVNILTTQIQTAKENHTNLVFPPDELKVIVDLMSIQQRLIATYLEENCTLKDGIESFLAKIKEG